MLTITSCRIDLVPSDILSNSSMQHIPLSLSTRAPLQSIASVSSHKGRAPQLGNSRLQDMLSGLRVLSDIGC